MAQPLLIGWGWWSIVTRPSPVPRSGPPQRLRSMEGLPRRVLIGEGDRHGLPGGRGKRPLPEERMKGRVHGKRLRNGTVALAVMCSAAFLASQSSAVEPEIDPPAKHELVAPHADLPDFQLEWACCDDRTAAEGEAADVAVVEGHEHSH